MEIQTYRQIQEHLARHQLAPNKKFGQNFLLDEHILTRIAHEVPEGGHVLEIGPGLGALTHHLLNRAKQVTCVEIDHGLIPALEETQSDHQNLSVICGDILSDQTFSQALAAVGRPYMLVANLPYYITTPILMKFLEAEEKPEAMVLMMQKEVAQRICAKEGGKDYGILTIAVQYYADVELLFTVKPGSFYPRPNVDSCVIRVNVLDKPRYPVEDERLFFQTVRASFAMRRKTLQNNLRSGFPQLKTQIPVILQEANIDGRRRGETLSIPEFANLSRIIFHYLRNTH